MPGLLLRVILSLIPHFYPFLWANMSICGPWGEPEEGTEPAPRTPAGASSSAQSGQEQGLGGRVALSLLAPAYI